MIQSINSNNIQFKQNTLPSFKGAQKEFTRSTKYLDKFLKSQENLS